MSNLTVRGPRGVVAIRVFAAHAGFTAVVQDDTCKVIPQKRHIIWRDTEREALKEARVFANQVTNKLRGGLNGPQSDLPSILIAAACRQALRYA